MVIDLFDPYMSPVHRCGAGGLACAIQYVNQNRLPIRGKASFTSDTITLEGPSMVDLLQDIAKHNFQLDANGFVKLPAVQDPNMTDTGRETYHDILRNTLIAHRASIKKRSEDKNDGGLQSYAHQDFAENFQKEEVTIKCYIVPWTSNLHGSNSATECVQRPPQAACYHYFMIGASFFSLQRGSALIGQYFNIHAKAQTYGYGVLVPDVINLERFVARRRSHFLSPTDSRGYTKCGIGDITLTGWLVGL
jgi:hypothetical protein